MTALMKTVVSVATLFRQSPGRLVTPRRDLYSKRRHECGRSAPSAKRSRNIFGARNAVRKASRFRLAPKSEAITISRTSPRMRLHKIAIPTTPVARALTRLLPVLRHGRERTRASAADLPSEKRSRPCIQRDLSCGYLNPNILKYMITRTVVCLSVLLAAISAPQSFGQDKTKTAVLAGGCFWCIQPAFDKAPGVISTVVGYSGGTEPNPTYELVGSRKN